MWILGTQVFLISALKLFFHLRLLSPVYGALFLLPEGLSSGNGLYYLYCLVADSRPPRNRINGGRIARQYGYDLGLTACRADDTQTLV